MAETEATVDAGLRQQVVTTMTDLLGRMLRLDHPVTEDMTLEADLALSSSQSAQLVLDLESDLSIMVDVEELDADEVCTVGALADYIASHSSAQ